MPMPVVSMEEIFPHVVQVTMCDRENKNTFSPQLIEGLIDTFAAINTHREYKVVVLTGYDSYFACGGTQAGLIALCDARGKFTDRNFYRLLLDCELPVISAMQGHAIGGGFVFGLFADVVVLSRESVYTTNFMKYGFTPAMGATYILPAKLGLGLAQELLLTARSYRGAELEKRGIPFPVRLRSEVVGHAWELAKDLAEKPRISLVTLKTQLIRHVNEALLEVIPQEIAMHESTFGLSEVRERIQSLFGLPERIL